MLGRIFILIIALAISTSSHAWTLSVTDTPVADNHIFDACVGQDSCATAEGLFTLTGTSSIFAGGESVPNSHLAPAPTGAYAAVILDGLGELQIAGDPWTSIQFNWGSVDDPRFLGDGTNIFTAGTFTLKGSALLDAMNAMQLEGDRNVGVTITGLDPFTTAGWFNNPGTVFEFNAVGQVGGESAVPEASTWFMMLMGFAGLAYAGRRRIYG